MEVGDEIRNVSVAYGADGYQDDAQSGSGDDVGGFKGDEENVVGLHERKVKANF